MSDDIKKQHISSNERDKWTNHIGANGTNHHPLGNGTTSGFSDNNFTNSEKNNLQILVNKVGGVRITIGTAAPPNPLVDEELWINRTTSPASLMIYTPGGWEKTAGVFF